MQPMSAGKVKGIDVSHYNGNINWTKVKSAGYQFVYAKATESTDFIDNKFLSYVTTAKAVGLHVGAYHFARPNGSAADGTTEAKYFVSTLKKVDTDLMPCLDLEASSLSTDETASWVDNFANYVYSETGKKILLYTGLWFVNQHPGLSTKLSKYPLWVSYYKTSAPPNNGWTQWTAWQYSETGTVPGISGGVDLNVAVSIDALLASSPTPSTMYDLSYLKDDQLIDLVSSSYQAKIIEKVAWAINARADCTLLVKRGSNLRNLQKALNEMYAADTSPKSPPTSSSDTTATMYDVSYLKDAKLVPLISSAYPNLIIEKMTWAMNARADCTLLVKRGFDLRNLQKALNDKFPPPTMFDLSYLKDGQLVGLISSSYQSKITEEITWAIGARADCTLMVKRSFDLRNLQKALNDMYTADTSIPYSPLTNLDTTTMFDVSYLENDKLVPLISSAYPDFIIEKMMWAMNARADCTLMVKRDFDLRNLQKILNDIYPIT